ncbi:MAG: permease [Verrucomicrobia bacterium]|nr:permease [Verrucomicrobiota bacterium]
MRDWKKFTMLLGVFLMAYYVPFDHPKVGNAILEGFRLLQWYAVNHTLACVVPAMFIAGAISTFLSQTSVLRYLGPRSNRTLAYGVASVSGMILAVCSCSVLPMFAGIYSMGAGLGPASAFLYSGPAINVLAVFLSARVLGLDLGVARAVGAITFAVIIGLLMHFVFRRSEARRQAILMQMPEEPPSRRPLWKTALFFASMVTFLIFSDWYNTNDVTITLRDGTRIEANVRFSRPETVEIQQYDSTGRLGTELRRLSRTDTLTITPKPGWVMTVHGMKWGLAGVMGLIVALMTWRWFDRQERKDWMKATWDFGMLIVPLLFGGVFITGVIGALIPESQVATWVGGNSLASNFVAAFVGMIWYFATLTEIPIVEMLTRLGMGKGPALALLLAGPALSLPSILVIHTIIGARKTFVFCFLVVAMSTIVGMAFGALA